MVILEACTYVNPEGAAAALCFLALGIGGGVFMWGASKIFPQPPPRKG